MPSRFFAWICVCNQAARVPEQKKKKKSFKYDLVENLEKLTYVLSVLGSLSLENTPQNL